MTCNNVTLTLRPMRERPGNGLLAKEVRSGVLSALLCLRVAALVAVHSRYRREFAVRAAGSVKLLPALLDFWSFKGMLHCTTALQCGMASTLDRFVRFQGF